MPILYLAKFFEEEAYADDFISHRLYMNSAAYFAELEGDTSGRADRSESVVGIWQPDGIEIQIGDFTIDNADLAGPIIYEVPGLLERNILCLYAALSGPFESLSHATVPAFVEHLRVPQQNEALGPYTVCVHSVSQFEQRLLSAAKDQQIHLRAKPVTYYESEALHGMIPEEDWLFYKRTDFEHQREYRVIVDTRGAHAPAPFTFDVGDLSDIATKMTTSDFLAAEMQVKLPDE